MGNVTIQEVYKSFGALEVIHGISLDIADGEFVILVGPSGCGKSTLLRMIAGLEDIDSGEVVIDGRDVTDAAPKDRDIAMVFQNYALYPHMTIGANLGFSLRLRRAPKKEMNERINAAANILGLQDYLKRYPKELSGGQRQRVAMGRAIVRDPKVFLFDEPLSNLDAKLRVSMRAEIKKLHKRLQTTIVYVTHDQVEAMTMADRIVVMHDGIIEQVGTPLELYDRPKNVFVAGFIGSPAMNLIKGKLAFDDKGVATVNAGRGIVFPIASVAPEMDGRKVVFGIRPENVQVTGSGVPAKIVSVEPTGAETMVLLNMNDIDFVAIIRERLDLEVGQTIKVSVDPEAIHLFDGQTENRIVRTSEGVVETLRPVAEVG